MGKPCEVHMKYHHVGIFVSFLSVSCCTAKPSKIQERPQTKEIASPVPSSSAIPAPPPVVIEQASTVCPADMVQVTGEYCTNLEEICLKWLDEPSCGRFNEKKECIYMIPPMRCAEFKYPTVCKGKTIHMDFCIDKYEYPNQPGVKPKLQNTWYQAKAQCEAQGKRLCVDNEWTQACRGPDNRPYPYGYVRDATACRIDLPWQDPATHTFEQLDKTVGAGTMPKCVSPYGAYDMTGNGDEWCKSSGGSEFISVLKGGHPHGVRNRCTPRTEVHGPDFSFYDTGFRCCKDIQ